ncbi:MAG: DUF2779 domain-containing protein [Spirochaetia bacterium]
MVRIEPVTQQEYLAGGQCLRKVYEGRRECSPQPGRLSGPRGLSPRAIRFTVEQADIVRNVVRGLYASDSSYALSVQLNAWGCTATVDVLESRPDGSVLPIVIQPTYTVKPQALDMLRYQLFLLEKAGYRAHGGKVVCLVKDYERTDPMILEDAFRERDCSRQLAAGLKQVPNRIRRIFEALSSDHPPEPCEQRDKCPACAAPSLGAETSSVGEETSGRDGTQKEGSDPPLDTGLHTLFKGGGMVAKLREQGYSSLDELPISVLPGRRQRLQVHAVQERRRHVDLPGLARFCERMRYPRVFLDFETISQALPPVVGTRSWEHVPIQFSLHRRENKGAPLTHIDFIADDLRPDNDPRESLASRLAGAIEGAGSVMVFSAAFERRVLSRLAQWVPRVGERFRDAIEKIVDVQEPFNEFLLYLPAQRGKTGLKTILPAVTGSGYESLDISDGLDASLRWFFDYRRSSPDSSPSEAVREQVGAKLREYCALDTSGLVSIVQYIEGQVDSHDLATGH